MNIAIVHYHLNRGGVTQVVKNHLRSFGAMSAELRPERVMLMHGGRSKADHEGLNGNFAKTRILEVEIPVLNYSRESSSEPQSTVLARRMERSLVEFGFARDTTVLHVHNHALGKNVSLPGALSELANSGYALLLQIHDFVEDFRAAEYCRLRNAIASDHNSRMSDLLYPQGVHVHYAVLNRRDWSVLRQAGVDEGRLHLLPNPVELTGPLQDRTTARQEVGKRFGIEGHRHYVLYPVRGIRRKNLGEALLWAAAGRATSAFGFTLPPLNPGELPRYSRWRELARRLGLPCFFEVGGEKGISLAQNLAAGEAVITTSLAEGFGFVFLESCLSRLPLLGRDLPDLTHDFVQEGMSFRGLKPRVDVPVKWIGQAAWREMLVGTYNATLQSYGRDPVSPTDLNRGLDVKLLNDCVDFGDLNADMQEFVLDKICQEAGAMETLIDINPFLREAFGSDNQMLLSEADWNSKIVQSAYSLERCGVQLSALYRTILASPRSGLSCLTAGEKILDAFLSLPRFRPVRL